MDFSHFSCTQWPSTGVFGPVVASMGVTPANYKRYTACAVLGGGVGE